MSPAQKNRSPSGSFDTAENGLSREAWKVIFVVLLGPLMAQMDSTIVNVSLSNIRDALHSTIASAQWIISGYLLALALMLPLNGWIVDRLGAKKLYLWCFAAFTLASALCGAAHAMNELICARLLQGMAGGLLAPLAQMMLARVAGRNMARVIGYAATPVLLAPTFGPIVAGVILKYLSWPWLFYVNLPVGILAVTLAFFLLPSDEPVIKKRPFDFRGFVLISPGLVCLIYGFEQASRHEGFSFLVFGVLLVSAFIWHAKARKEKALIDLSLFKNRIFSTAVITQFLTNGVMYAGQFLIPLYLTVGCGLSAEKVGWMLAPMGIGMMCIYPFMGTLTDRFGCRAVAVGGVLLNVLGTVPFLWMTLGESSPPWVMACLFARGIGQGATGIPAIAAAYASVTRDKLGLATTAVNIVQRLGGPIATTIVAILVSTSVSKTTAGGGIFFIPFVALILIQLFVLTSASRLPVRIPQQG
jgi:EmrB/QacA subfamily drug resistance transporter